MRKRFVLGILVLLLAVLCVPFKLAHAQESNSKLLITQVRPGDKSTARLIELYNNSDAVLDITGWCVYYSAAASVPATSMTTVNERACFATSDISERLLLPARSYLVIAASIPDFEDDFTMTEGLGRGTAGHVFIADNTKTVHDVLGWGTAEHAEGNPVAITDTDGRVLERKQSSAGEYIDTDDNASDFMNTNWRENYSVGNIIEATDYCLNISGLESEVPIGYSRNPTTGMCQEISQNPTVCRGVIISEVLPNPAGADAGKEFIELHNPTNTDMVLQNCALKTSANATEFLLDGVELPRGEYKAFYDSETKLTLPNAGGGTVWLLSDTDDIDEIKYPENMTDDVSYAWFGGEDWRATYALTPSGENLWLASKPCPEGQERSDETGRCRNIPVTAALADCGPGRYRHPETNRCRNIASAANTLKPCAANQYRNPETNRCRKIDSGSTLTPCAADQYRNPETNRCRKIDSGSSLKPCNPDQERNPETNRCRKVPEILSAVTNPAAIPDNRSKPLGFDYRVWGALGTLVAGYGLYEYRTDARQWLSRLRSKKLKHKPPG